MTTDTLTLTDFLLARIAEDEAVARSVTALDYSIDMGGNRQDERWYVSRLRFSSADGAARSEHDAEASAHFTRHNPARVLAECEAKRRIVEEHGDADPCDAHDGATLETVECFTLHTLAAVYADHPDYRDEWRP